MSIARKLMLGGAPPQFEPIYKGIHTATMTGGSHTFSARDVGKPHSSRKVLVNLSTFQGAAGTITGLTVGGSSLTTQVGNYAGSNRNMITGWVDLPAGATADVAVTLSDAGVDFFGYMTLALIYGDFTLVDSGGSLTAHTATNITTAPGDIIIVNAFSSGYSPSSRPTIALSGGVPVQQYSDYDSPHGNWLGAVLKEDTPTSTSQDFSATSSPDTTPDGAMMNAYSIRPA